MLIKPLRDNVLLRAMPYEHETLAMPLIKINRGEVIAIGPGRRVRRLVHYKRAEGSLTEGVWLPDGPETGQIRPMRVKVGDIVDYSRNKHTLDFEFEGQPCVLIAEQSIYGRDVSGEKGHAILAARPAGWERGRNGAADTFLAR